MALVKCPLPKLIKCDGIGCEDHQEDWCNTLARFYTTPNSGNTLWSTIDKEMEGKFPKLSWQIRVPVFPSWENMWTEANLKMLPKSTDALIVEVLIGQKETFLGVVTREDHLGTIRTMVLERIKSESIHIGDGSNYTIPCSAASHSFSHEIQWQDLLKEAPFHLRRLVNVWSLMHEDSCYLCYVNGKQAWDDLVPDDGKKKSIW